MPITTEEIATSIYEFSESPNNSLTDEDAVLVTSCHGSKGLEFSKVILLTDNFSEVEHQLEDERRLFYVAITRAKEELILCSIKSNQCLRETQVQPIVESLEMIELPKRVHYFDFNPGDVYLSARSTQFNQDIIKTMREGDSLYLWPNSWGNGWSIFNDQKIEIGAFSKKCNQFLGWKGLKPNEFRFQPREVTIRYVYRHVKTAEDSDEILENWYVVIPQIRIYR